MEFSRQEYWSGLLFPSLGDFPDPGTEPGFPTLQAYSLPSELTYLLHAQKRHLPGFFFSWDQAKLFFFVLSPLITESPFIFPL